MTVTDQRKIPGGVFMAAPSQQPVIVYTGGRVLATADRVRRYRLVRNRRTPRPSRRRATERGGGQAFRTEGAWPSAAAVIANIIERAGIAEKKLLDFKKNTCRH